MAERQGLELHKARRLDRYAIDYGKFTIVDPETDTIVAGEDKAGRATFSMDQVEAWLKGDRRPPSRRWTAPSAWSRRSSGLGCFSSFSPRTCGRIAARVSITQHASPEVPPANPAGPRFG